MNLAQRRLLMNEFIFLQFGYSSLVWMFHSKKLNNRIKNIRKRALRTDFRDYKSTFHRSVKQNEFVICTSKKPTPRFLRKQMA